MTAVQSGGRARPRVSVIMGVYNCESTVEAAVSSIQDQVFTDWELIVCDDGSADTTLAHVSSMADRDGRIRVIRNPSNLGLAPTLNRCLAEATGDLVARMDGDDQCSPIRFTEQVEYLDANPGVDFLSSALQFFDHDGVWGGTTPTPFPQPKDLIRGNPFGHGGVMARRSLYDELNGYSESDLHWRVEDYDLWVRAYAEGLRGANLGMPLYGLRNDRAASLRRSRRARRNESRLKYRAGLLFGSGLEAYATSVVPLALAALPVGVYEFAYKAKHVRGRDVPADRACGYPSENGWESG